MTRIVDILYLCSLRDRQLHGEMVRYKFGEPTDIPDTFGAGGSGGYRSMLYLLMCGLKKPYHRIP